MPLTDPFLPNHPNRKAEARVPSRTPPQPAPGPSGTSGNPGTPGSAAVSSGGGGGVRGDGLTERFIAARRVSTPLIAVSTPDPAATVDRLTTHGLTDPAAVALTWDVVRGVMPRGDAAKAALDKLRGESGDVTVGNPLNALLLAEKLPPKAVLFVLMADRWLNDPRVVQAAWLLRDRFKGDGRTLVMLAPDFVLPAELAGDVVVLDEALPDPAALRAMLGHLHEAAGLPVPGADDGRADAAVEAMTGLTAFAAEQVAAMSLRRSGVDVDQLWERKTKQIERTPGLKVHRGGAGFDGIGGVAVVKGYVQRIMTGRSRPNAVVFLDEIEKMLGGGASGAGGHGDTSGVSQDQLGTLLAYMQDQDAAGMILIGPPGTSKSMVAKAAGTAGGVPTVQLDLGAAKGSLVGQSERQLREALRVVTHVSNGRSLWIATCNAITALPPELRRRFTLGTFFFDLPDAAERGAIWKLHLGAYDLLDQIEMIDGGPQGVDDEGWTGAEIRQCCDIAWRLGVPLDEAAAFVVPVSRSAADQVDALRASAEGRFLSASHPGVYRRSHRDPHPDVHASRLSGRRLELEEAR